MSGNHDRGSDPTLLLVTAAQLAARAMNTPPSSPPVLNPAPPGPVSRPPPPRPASNALFGGWGDSVAAGKRKRSTSPAEDRVPPQFRRLLEAAEVASRQSEPSSAQGSDNPQGGGTARGQDARDVMDPPAGGLLLDERAVSVQSTTATDATSARDDAPLPVAVGRGLCVPPVFLPPYGCAGTSCGRSGMPNIPGLDLATFEPDEDDDHDDDDHHHHHYHDFPVSSLPGDPRAPPPTLGPLDRVYGYHGYPAALTESDAAYDRATTLDESEKSVPRFADVIIFDEGGTPPRQQGPWKAGWPAAFDPAGEGGGIDDATPAVRAGCDDAAATVGCGALSDESGSIGARSNNATGGQAPERRPVPSSLVWYPFLLVAKEVDDDTAALRAAESCLAASSAACLGMVEALNRVERPVVRDDDDDDDVEDAPWAVPPPEPAPLDDVDDAIFSVALTPARAVLYCVSHARGQASSERGPGGTSSSYAFRKLRTYCCCGAAGRGLLEDHMRAIVDWGTTRRAAQVRARAEADLPRDARSDAKKGEEEEEGEGEDLAGAR